MKVSLIPVMVKQGNRKVVGGVLNPHAVHGHGFYVRRIVPTKSITAAQKQLTTILNQLEAA